MQAQLHIHDSSAHLSITGASQGEVISRTFLAPAGAEAEVAENMLTDLGFRPAYQAEGVVWQPSLLDPNRLVADVRRDLRLEQAVTYWAPGSRLRSGEIIGLHGRKVVVQRYDTYGAEEITEDRVVQVLSPADAQAAQEEARQIARDRSISRSRRRRGGLRIA